MMIESQQSVLLTVDGDANDAHDNDQDLSGSEDGFGDEEDCHFRYFCGLIFVYVMVYLMIDPQNLVVESSRVWAVFKRVENEIPWFMYLNKYLGTSVLCRIDWLAWP